MRGRLVDGRFEVEERAGAGGMGEVYRALDRRSGERVALKIVVAPGASTLARFVREAELLGELAHPAIVRYVAHGRDERAGAWLAMEWLDGEDLDARLRRGPLALSDAVALGARVARGLAVAHARGVTHRDVKPANLFLVGGDPGRVRILDLGIARLGADRSLTRTGALIGTPAFMAPEQARGADDVDARADVFALGAVLHECVTGERVFAGERPVAVLARVLLESVPLLDELCEGVPSPLCRLVERMLDKDPARRPADGAEVAIALEALADLPDAPVPRRSQAPQALTRAERRLLCVVLGRPRVDRGEAPDLGDAPTVDTRPLAALAGVARAHGLEVAQLADGSLLCALGEVPSGLGVEAARAARFALALVDAEPALCLAVATGRAAADDRLPVGEVVDRAARLAPDEPGVRLDDGTARLLEDRFVVQRQKDAIALRGERAGVVGARTLLGRATPCVGRERELRAVERCLDECLETPVGLPVLVTGEAGAGKSRFRDELLRRAADRVDRITVWEGRGDPVSAGSALSVLARALRSAARLSDAAPLDARHERLRRFAGRHLGAQSSPVAEMLGELLGAPFPDDGSPPLRAARADARLMADAMRRAFEELLIAVCDAGPLLLVLDDLQWGDRSTVSYVDSALRNLGSRPCLVVALGRPEVRTLFPDLWAERGVQHLALGPLRPRAARSLVAVALGDATPEPVIERILERAAGNAFALEELIRAEAEGHGAELPDTVLGLAEARIRRIEPEARRVLRAASVFGETFWPGGVRALLPDADVDRWLGELTDRELVSRRLDRRFAEEPELGFRHGLVREAAYAMLTGTDRALGHRLAAGWLEARGERDALALAEHWERGGDARRAAVEYLRAARQALDGDDLETVIARADRGLSCSPDDALRGELRLAQADALGWRGDFAGAAERATAGLGCLRPGTLRWYRAAGLVAGARGNLGDHEALGRLGEALLGTTPEPGAEGAAAVALARTGVFLLRAGRADGSTGLIERARETGATVAARDPFVAARLAQVRAHLAIHHGDLAGYLAGYTEAIALFDATADRRTACSVRINVGFARLELGDDGRAEATLREALGECRRMGLPHVEAAGIHNLGVVLARRGELEEACAAQREAISLAAAQRNRRLEGSSRSQLADALSGLGRHAEAEREAAAAADLLAQVAPPLHPRALAIVARVRLAAGDPGAAQEPAAVAYRRLEAAGGTLAQGEALVRLARAEALLGVGEVTAARAVLSAARSRLLERAASVTDPELRASLLRGVPEHARTLELADAHEATR